MKEQVQIFENPNSQFPFPLLLFIFFPSHSSLDFEENGEENLQFFMEAPFY